MNILYIASNSNDRNNPHISHILLFPLALCEGIDLTCLIYYYMWNYIRYKERVK